MSEFQNTSRMGGITLSNPHLRASSGRRGTLSEGSDIFYLLRLAILFAVPCLIVNGTLPQLQMALLRGSVPLPSVAVKAVVLGVFTAVVLLRAGRIKRNKPLASAAFLFFGYLLLDIVHLHFDLKMHLSDALYGYNFYYTLSLIAVLAPLVSIRIPDRYLLSIIGIAAVANAFLGAAQFVLNKPIIPTRSADGHFSVPTWMDAGKVKAFAFFGESQDCGLFFVFMTALLIAFCRNKKYRRFAVPLIPVSMALCLFSDARTQLMGLAWAVLASILITFWNRAGRVRLLPLFALPSAIPAVLYALYFGAAGHTHSIARSQSMLERIKEWSYYINVLRQLGFARIMFGMGIVETAQVQSIKAAVLIDNIYLTVVVHIGLVGLVLYLLLAWRLWQDVSRRAEERASYLHIAVAATFSTFFLMGIFNNAPIQLAAYFALFAISRSYERSKDETKSAATPAATAKRQVFAWSAMPR